jgi:ABC-type bacteriocin/lantibiotic exporter with double-glycine peptidase domain
MAIAINFAVGLLSLASPIMMQLLTDDVLVRGDTQLLATVAIRLRLRFAIAVSVMNVYR